MDERDEEVKPAKARTDWRQLLLGLNLFLGALCIVIGVATWSHGAAFIVGGLEVAALAVFSLADL